MVPDQIAPGVRGFLPTHGQSKTTEYRSWYSMIQRCTNPRVQYYYRYGGRGIEVCEEWRTFENFIRDMGRKPGPEYSLDRINNDGNYEPANCRWATLKEQGLNRTKRPGTSRFLGVSRCNTASGRWRAQLGTGNNKIHVGTFDTEEAAAEALEVRRSEIARKNVKPSATGDGVAGD